MYPGNHYVSLWGVYCFSKETTQLHCCELSSDDGWQVEGDKQFIRRGNPIGIYTQATYSEVLVANKHQNYYMQIQKNKRNQTEHDAEGQPLHDKMSQLSRGRQ